MPLSNRWQYSSGFERVSSVQSFKIMVHRFEWSLLNCSVWVRAHHVYVYVCWMWYKKCDAIYFASVSYCDAIENSMIELKKSRANCGINKHKSKRKWRNKRFTEYDSIEDQQSPWHMHTRTQGDERRKKEWKKRFRIELKMEKKWNSFVEKKTIGHCQCTDTAILRLQIKRGYIAVFHLYGDGFPQITQWNFVTTKHTSLHSPIFFSSSSNKYLFIFLLYCMSTRLHLVNCDDCNGGQFILGESMAMSGIYGLRNSLSESNSSLSNSSMNGSCIGTSFVSGTTPTGSSPDDSSMQLSASLTSNPFSHLTSVSLSSSGSLNTPIKNFDNLQVKPFKYSITHTHTRAQALSHRLVTTGVDMTLAKRNKQTTILKVIRVTYEAEKTYALYLCLMQQFNARVMPLQQYLVRFLSPSRKLLFFPRILAVP